MTRGIRALIAAGMLLVLIPDGSAQAQPPPDYPHLGLSAAPDAYVNTLDVEQGQPFTLYMIMIGPDGGPLPFDLSETDWTVYAACCGATYNVLGITYNENMQHSGELPGEIHSVVEICNHQDFVQIAAITLVLTFEQTGAYLLPAGATGPTLDCDGGVHLLMDLSVTLNVLASGTPTEPTSWGTVKATYR